MHELNKSPKADTPKKRISFARSAGLFPLISCFMIILGLYTGELAIALWGSVFFSMQLSGIVAVLLLALANHSRIKKVNLTIFPGEVCPNEIIHFTFERTFLFSIPGIQIIYDLNLLTRDGRSFHVALNPRQLSITKLAPNRGAYFSVCDIVSIQDWLGLFNFSFYIPCESTERLIVLPLLEENYLQRWLEQGGSELRIANSYQRTEDLTDNRHYLPGDDPRRINWKLYGHAGELFVREGEPEPPPSSRTLILIDTSFDQSIYSIDTAHEAVDMLCSVALNYISQIQVQGFLARFAYTGSTISSGESHMAASFFAKAAAFPINSGRALPDCEANDRSILVLALPRKQPGLFTLDNFICTFSSSRRVTVAFLDLQKKKGKPKSILKRLLFISRENFCDTSFTTLSSLVDSNISFYNTRGTVHAERIKA